MLDNDWLFRTKRPEKKKLETPMKFAALAGIAAAIYAIPAVAHHSFAMFDAGQTTTLEGTVKEFQWTNPHAWIMLTVAKEGQAQDWAIEMNGPTGLVRQGWRPKTLTPGMPVTMTIHPLRDGSNGGQFLEIKLPDGTVMGRGAAPPPNQ
jgi:hypothetical protein